MEKISPNLNLHFPNLNLHFPNLSLQMVSDQIQETFCSKATKTSQDAVETVVIPYLFGELELWIGFTKVWHIWAIRKLLFEHNFFFHFEVTFYGIFGKHLKTRLMEWFSSWLWPGETGVGKSVGIQQFLGSAGDAFAVSWTRVDAWWLVMVGKWLRGQKSQKMYLYCFGLFFGLPIKFTETFFCSATWKNHHEFHRILDFHIYIYIYITVPKKTWEIL